MIRSSSTRSGGHGPAEVQATLVSRPKMPSRLAWCGRIRRCESRCSRRYASAAAPARRRATAIVDVDLDDRRQAGQRAWAGQRRERRRIRRAGRPGRGGRPGNQTSSVCRPSVTVDRPLPHAGPVRNALTVGHRTKRRHDADALAVPGRPHAVAARRSGRADPGARRHRVGLRQRGGDRRRGRGRAAHGAAPGRRAARQHRRRPYRPGLGPARRARRAPRHRAARGQLPEPDRRQHHVRLRHRRT